MANKKKNKYPVAKHRNASGAATRLIVKNGAYDGSGDSSEFHVSGHAMGSEGTEMEEMSYQVSRDAGVIPEYDFDQPGSYMDADDLDDGPGFGDLGGPEYYGNKPTLLKRDKNSPLYRRDPMTNRQIGMWSAIGIAGSAALAAIAVVLYKNNANQKHAVRAHARATAKKTAGTRAMGARAAGTKATATKSTRKPTRNVKRKATRANDSARA